MTTAFTLVAPGFLNAAETARDLSKNTGLSITLAEAGSGPNVLHASVVEQFTPECAANAGISGRPGCAYFAEPDGHLQADVASWVATIYGEATQTAALKHELYHLLASRFQSIATHSTNPRSLMYAAWNPRQPPGFTAADRRLLKDYYGGLA